MTPRFVLDSARLAGPPLLRCQTDERLVELVRAGNDRAFEAIVERYRRALLRYCARLLPLARAEDAVQQAFLNAYAAMRGGDAELDLRPWLYRIARNACLNALRENGWTHEQIENVGRGAESAHDVVERRQELRAVVAAVHMLPDRQREAVVLRELEGRSYDQIAAQLDSSDGAVRQLLNRARNTLRAGATALTPVALLSRLPLGSQPVVGHVSEAAGHEVLRSGLGRAVGVAAASLALLAGLADAPRHLLSGRAQLEAMLASPETLARLSDRAPALPPRSGTPALGGPSGVTLAFAGRLPAARLAAAPAGPGIDAHAWAAGSRLAPSPLSSSPPRRGSRPSRADRRRGDARSAKRRAGQRARRAVVAWSRRTTPRARGGGPPSTGSRAVRARRRPIAQVASRRAAGSRNARPGRAAPRRRQPARRPAAAHRRPAASQRRPSRPAGPGRKDRGADTRPRAVGRHR